MSDEKYPAIEEKPLTVEKIRVDTIDLEPVLIIPSSTYGVFIVDDVEYRDILGIERTGDFRTYKSFRSLEG